MRALISILLSLGLALACPANPLLLLMPQPAASSGALSLADVSVLDSYNTTASTNVVDLDATSATPGDLLLACVTNVSTQNVNSVDGSWTLVQRQDDGNASTAPDTWVWWKIASGSEASYNFGLDAAIRASGVLVQVRNASYSSSDKRADGVLAVITVPTGGLAIVFMGQAGSADTQPTLPPGSYTELFDNGATGRRAANHVAAWVTSGATNGTDTYSGVGNPNTIHVAVAVAP